MSSGVRRAAVRAGAVALLIATATPGAAQRGSDTPIGSTAPSGSAVQGGSAAPGAGATAAEPPRAYRTTGSRIAFGRSIEIARDEEVTDAVVVVGGSLRVDGRVRDGIVVIGGDVALGPDADVRGDVVLVGGRLLRADGSQLRGSVSDVSFGQWGSWQWGGWRLPVVGFGDVGRWLGLLGALFRIALVAILMALVLLVARAPVARVGLAAAAEPGRALLVGLAAAILFLPALVIASIGLIVTIIGIPLVALLVPTAFLFMFAALLLGFTGIACRLGQGLGDRLGWRGHSAFLASAVGLFLVIGPTLAARLVGLAPEPWRFAAWALLLTGVLIEGLVWTIGLGAALVTGFGRWHPSPPPLPPLPQTGVVTAAG